MEGKITERTILTILNQIANDVSSELDLDTVLQSTSRLVRQVMDYTSFIIALVNKDGTFEIAFQKGYSPEAIEQVCIKADKGIIGQAVMEKEIIKLDDVSSSPRYIPVPTEDGREPKSMLAVPLISKNEVIGAIGIESTNPEAFTENHRLMMRTIASHLGIAVANARRYQKSIEQIKLMRVVEQIGQDVTSVLDLDQLLQEIARITKEVIDYQAFGVFLIDRDKGKFKPRFSLGYDKQDLRQRKISLDQGMRGETFRQNRPMISNDVLNDPKHVSYKLEINDAIRSQMYIPLRTRKGVIGVLVLGNVKKDFYSERHLRIAHGMASQVAIALENATEFEEVSESEERLRHEIEIAKSLQLSMLPHCCPYIPGYELQAQSRPAANVGGDFYDFIELDKGKLGIVIGDVSGYGIPGALVMASARQVIRIYSELDPHPETVMNNADKRLHKDLSKHMFVALLYGVLDTNKSTLTFCNAGLIEPALVRDGDSSFLGSPGTRLPLGKMPDGNYKPRTIKLNANDLIVLSTDGCIEAIDSRGKQFGYQQFLESISKIDKSCTKSDSEYLDFITRMYNHILKYTGGHLYDDMTLLTIKKTRP